MFKVGQKVVCVDTDIHQELEKPGLVYNRELDGLVKNKIYTIRDIGFSHFENYPVVWLEEIRRPRPHRHAGFPEAPYWAGRFRPLQERSTETGIAILRSILKGAKVDERV